MYSQQHLYKTTFNFFILNYPFFTNYSFIHYLLLIESIIKLQIYIRTCCLVLSIRPFVNLTPTIVDETKRDCFCCTKLN